MNENVLIALIVCGTIVFCALIALMIVLWCKVNIKHKERLLELSQKHEKDLINLEFSNKKEWEDKINAHLKENKEIVDKLEKLKKDIINEVSSEIKKTNPVDLNRVAMIHLILSGCKEEITAENLDAEIKKVEKTYQLLKDKVS